MIFVLIKEDQYSHYWSIQEIISVQNIFVSLKKKEKTITYTFKLCKFEAFTCQHHCVYVASVLCAQSRICGRSYWGLVRRPWYEDPLVALCILGVKAVQDVAGLLVVQERKQEVIIILVPAFFGLSVGPQHQLLWKSEQYSSHTLTPPIWSAPFAEHIDTYRSSQMILQSAVRGSDDLLDQRIVAVLLWRQVHDIKDGVKLNLLIYVLITFYITITCCSGMVRSGDKSTFICENEIYSSPFIVKDLHKIAC